MVFQPTTTHNIRDLLPKLSVKHTTPSMSNTTGPLTMHRMKSQSRNALSCIKAEPLPHLGEVLQNNVMGPVNSRRELPPLWLSTPRSH